PAQPPPLPSFPTRRSSDLTAVSGDSIVFTNDIALTTGDLPNVGVDLTINGAGHSLSGNNQYRGLFIAAFGVLAPTPAPITVNIQDRKSTRLNSSHLGISYA